MTNRTVTAAVALAGIIGLAGCGHHLEIEDEYSRLLESEVHQPYALGTEVDLTARWSSNDAIGAWTAKTENAGIVTVLEQHRDGTRLSLRTKAVAEGQTRLVVRDERGEVVGGVDLRVERPATIELDDRALERTQGEERDVGPEIRVVAGQPAALEVRLRSALGERLYGRDLVRFTQVEGLLSWVEHETLAHWAEYLLVQADEPGTYELPLALEDPASGALRTLRVTAVDASAIASLSLLHPPEGSSEPDDWICAGLLAYDAAGERVYAPPAEWTVAGSAIGSGDLLCYHFDPSLAPQDITVSVGQAHGQIAIRGTDFDAQSSAAIGCAVGGSPPRGALGGALLALVVVLGAARRRR